VLVTVTAYCDRPTWHGQVPDALPVWRRCRLPLPELGQAPYTSVTQPVLISPVFVAGANFLMSGHQVCGGEAGQSGAKEDG